MKLEVDIGAQNLLFIQAFILGACIGLFYDFFRVMRILLPCGKVIVIIQDILFWIISAVGIFLFMLIFNLGMIRGYLLAAIALGAATYFFSLGMLVTRLFKWLDKYIHKFFRFIHRRIFMPTLGRFFKFLTAKIKKFGADMLKKVTLTKKVKKSMVQPEKNS